MVMSPMTNLIQKHIISTIPPPSLFLITLLLSLFVFFDLTNPKRCVICTLGDVRLLGTPLQQQIRPPMPLIFQPRQRLMGTVAAASAAAAAAAVGNGNHHHHPSAPGVSAKSGRSRRSWTRNNSRDNAGGVHRNTADGHDMGQYQVAISLRFHEHSF